MDDPPSATVSEPRVMPGDCPPQSGDHAPVARHHALGQAGKAQPRPKGFALHRSYTQTQCQLRAPVERLPTGGGTCEVQPRRQPLRRDPEAHGGCQTDAHPATAFALREWAARHPALSLRMHRRQWSHESVTRYRSPTSVIAPAGQ